MFPGRSREQKRELVKELTSCFVRTCGGPESAVTVVLSDIEKEDWGSGGELCIDKFPD
jgi:4-oxalocrotonate tautomerase